MEKERKWRKDKKETWKWAMTHTTTSMMYTTEIINDLLKYIII